jgi:hypothetical protein
LENVTNADETDNLIIRNTLYSSNQHKLELLSRVNFGEADETENRSFYTIDRLVLRIDDEQWQKD